MSKKVSVDLSDLTPTYINGEYSYTLRYRVIADNKNRVSEWSPFYDIPAPQGLANIGSVSTFDSNVTSTTIPGSKVLFSIFLETTPALSSDQKFDIFVRKFDPITSSWGAWGYLNTQQGNQITVIVENSYSQIDISIHAPSYPKEPKFLSNGDLNTHLRVLGLTENI